MTTERYSGNRWELIDQACANAERRAAEREGMAVVARQERQDARVRADARAMGPET